MCRTIKCVECGSKLAEVYDFDGLLGMAKECGSENKESVFWICDAITPHYTLNKGVTSVTCNKCHTDQSVFKRFGKTYVRSYPHLVVRRNKT